MQPFRPSTPSRCFSPTSMDSSAVEKESHIGSNTAVQQSVEVSEQHVRDYEQKRDTMSGAIAEAEHLIGDVINNNRENYPLRYCLVGPASGGQGSSSSRPGALQRSLTFTDRPTEQIPVEINTESGPRHQVRRTMTTMTPREPIAGPSSDVTPSDICAIDETAYEQDDFSILRLDVNLGVMRQSKNLMSRLEKSSIASLIDSRLVNVLEHLSSLNNRINDPQSRVLVTGDLNAGKSTLVNALLRLPNIMPTDEQPLTSRFVEVISARENAGVEEIHVLLPGVEYDPSDKSTYHIKAISDLEGMVADMETDVTGAPVRIYLNEVTEGLANPSILHNGVVDISLIDAPGLNRDSIKTTANFARQEEIDVVVFVVSAANHFTLSAKEFIWQAGHEKAHLFIVVNRFDQIKDKEKCRRIVLEQIKQLSPKTYEDAADLVHFVDSAKVALGFEEDSAAGDEIDEAFSHLEHSLRSFVLVNRSKSKLGPAQNYLLRLLADVELLASANTIVATRERDVAQVELAQVKPVLEKMKKGQEGLSTDLSTEEDQTIDLATSRSRQAMVRGLERVGQGQLAAPGPGLSLPAYPGILGLWDYAAEYRKTFLASLDFVATLAQDDARGITTEGVDHIREIGERYLPADVERSNKVFNPAAMFTASLGRGLKRPTTGLVGLGLSSQSSLSDVTITDIIDLHHHLFLARAHLPASAPSHELVPFAAEVSGFGAASLALGAYSMINGKTVGIRSIVESVIRLSDLAQSPAVRKWAGPVVGFVTLGTVAYIVYELPRSIPRNVGRHLQQTLMVTCGEDDVGLESYPDAVARMITKEVKKVVRLASDDIKNRYQTGMRSKDEIVKEQEEVVRKSGAAIEHYKGVDSRVQAIRGKVAEVKI